MWYESAESHAVHALSFVSTSFADVIIQMRQCFRDIVWAFYRGTS